MKQKLLLINKQSPGDIVMLTAAVRDLYKAHGNKFEINVDSTSPELWENNPYITRFNINDTNIKRIQCEYPLIHQSNQGPWHFIHGFPQYLESQLNLKIPVTDFKGDIHLSSQEKQWTGRLEEMGVKDKYWIIVAGGKFDFTAKWWNNDYWQQVVDHFKGKITFVQCGAQEHHHPPLTGVINQIGKTSTREFIRMVYHSVGVLCPVTFAMHLAAAIEMKPQGSMTPKNRPCVVIAGGREPAQWEAYPHHRYLSTNGALFCCDNGGCWKSRCQPMNDGDPKDRDLCLLPVLTSSNIKIPKCMDMIKPVDVIRAIEMYYEGGVLHYNL